MESILKKIDDIGFDGFKNSAYVKLSINLEKYRASYELNYNLSKTHRIFIEGLYDDINFWLSELYKTQDVDNFLFLFKKCFEKVETLKDKELLHEHINEVFKSIGE